MSLTVARRWLAGASLAVASGGMAAQGCTFPEVDFTGAGGTDGASTTRASVGTESSVQTGTSTSGSMATTSTSDGSSSTGTPPQCDNDGDDWPLIGPDCCDPGTGAKCDCDDDNPIVNPGRTTGELMPYMPSSGGAASYDYDCDGTITPDWVRGGCTSPQPSISCSAGNPSTELRFTSGMNIPDVCGTSVIVHGCHPPAVTCDQLGTQTLKCH